MTQHTLAKSLGIALIGIGCSTSLFAQKVWTKNDGKWSDANNWTGGVPNGTNSTNAAQFSMSSGSTASEVTVTIENGVAANTGYIEVGLGKRVILQLEDGVTLTTGALWGVGANIGSGSGAGHLTIKGPESGSASVTSGYFFVGRASASGGKNTLTFSGSNLVVNDNGTSASSVGRYTDNNTLFVENGATLNRYSLSLSPSNADAGRIGNGAIIRGAQSKLVLDGGALQIGNTAGTQDNYVKVENNGTLEVKGQKTILIGSGASYGGNLLEVSTGGKIKASGATTVYNYSKNEDNDRGDNRLSILSGGTFASSSSVAVQGLLQLEAGGALVGETLTGAAAALSVTINSGGRFEAEGDGLGKNVTTTVEDGGTFAIGLANESGPREGSSSLNLSSTINFSNNSILEIMLFGAGPTDIDQIILGATGRLFVGSNVTLKLIYDEGFIPQDGDSWTIFSGQTAGITGNFNLDSLDPTVWDTTRFNAAGNWQIRPIPEPKAMVALALGSALLGLHLSRQRRKVSHLS